MSIKNTLSVILVFTCLISFTACKASNDKASSIAGELPVSVTDDNSSLNDHTADIEINDSNYLLTIKDIYDHFDYYNGKTISISGIAFETDGRQFVGKYTSYPYNKQDDMIYLEFSSDWFNSSDYDKTTWITVNGTLRSASDELGTYYYIQAEHIDIIDPETIQNLDDISYDDYYCERELQESLAERDLEWYSSTFITRAILGVQHQIALVFFAKNTVLFLQIFFF